MPDLEFDATFQKETKAFLVYERRVGDSLEAIVYIARATWGGHQPEKLRVTISR